MERSDASHFVECLVYSREKVFALSLSLSVLSEKVFCTSKFSRWTQFHIDQKTVNLHFHIYGNPTISYQHRNLFFALLLLNLWQSHKNISTQKEFFCTFTFTFMSIPLQAVVMTGNLVDCCEPGKLNEIGTWHKPWFFKHVQGFFETGTYVAWSWSTCSCLSPEIFFLSFWLFSTYCSPQVRERNIFLCGSTTTGAQHIDLKEWFS